MVPPLATLSLIESAVVLNCVNYTYYNNIYPVIIDCSIVDHDASKKLSHVYELPPVWMKVLLVTNTI